MRFLPMVHSCLNLAPSHCSSSSSSSSLLGAATFSLGSRPPLSTIIFCTTVIILFLTNKSVGTEEESDESSQFSLLRRQAPYYNAELYKVLRQHYKYQDFLWAGSGEGPEISSENQDGIPWEDDDATSGQAQIKVTKTMVLYKTVLSTIYPVGLTPVVIATRRLSSTPTIEMTIIEPTNTSPSTFSTFSIIELNSANLISPTATLPFSPVMVTPTISPSTTFPPDSTTTLGHETSGETSESINDRLSASATDPRYWITTSIKKNRSDEYHPNDLAFHGVLQERLAEIYATAFKRQLLKSLRLMGQHNASGLTLRNRRSLLAINNVEYEEEDAEANPLYFFLRNQSPIAKTAMNVSVSMINVTWSEPEPQIDLKYIVYAENSPVQGFVAVKELQMISKAEMERTLRYEIIDKAKALIQPPERNEMGSVASTTPWLIALMALVCLMIMILSLTLFMAWKWRHNRLRDRHDQFPTISDEMVHPTPTTQGQGQALVGKRSGGESRPSPLAPNNNSSSPSSSAVFRVEQENGGGGAPQLPHQPPHPQPHPHHHRAHHRGIESLEEEEGRTSPRGSPPDDKSSSTSMLIAPSEGSSYNSHSPQRRLSKSKTSGVARKVNRRRRSRRRKTQAAGLVVGEEGSSDHPANIAGGGGEMNNLTPHNEYDNPDFSFTGDRNTDKLSFGNLEIYTDTDARPSSAQLKKILSRPSSHEAKKSSSSTLQGPENVFLSGNQEATTVHVHEEQQDRELSEKSFDGSENDEETDRKDAEVQTPTRLKRRAKSPRLRTSPKHRSSRATTNPTNKASKMSLISTESEEAVDFHNLPFSSQEINPIGRIRKRFHQFLDDAFNVMAVGRKESPGKCPQSAKVTVSHQMKSKTPGRPWTSHVIREESVRKIRPKSSVVIGPPKPAWGAGSEQRRCQSAKSKASIIEEEVVAGGSRDDELLDAFSSASVDADERRRRGRRQEEEENKSSSSTVRTDCHQSFSEASHSHSYVFPKYPTYPEVEVCFEQQDKNVGAGLPGTSSHQSSRRLHPNDPAVPLIEAIKDEMKRFEKVKVSSTSTTHEKSSKKS